MQNEAHTLYSCSDDAHRPTTTLYFKLLTTFKPLNRMPVSSAFNLGRIYIRPRWRDIPVIHRVWLSGWPMSLHCIRMIVAILNIVFRSQRFWLSGWPIRHVVVVFSLTCHNYLKLMCYQYQLSWSITAMTGTVNTTKPPPIPCTLWGSWYAGSWYAGHFSAKSSLQKVQKEMATGKKDTIQY